MTFERHGLDLGLLPVFVLKMGIRLSSLGDISKETNSMLVYSPLIGEMRSARKRIDVSITVSK